MLCALLALVVAVPFLAPHKADAEFYSYEDKSGTMHFVDDVSKIPKEYRQKKQVRKEEYDDLPADERARRLENDRERRAADQRREAEQQEYRQQRRQAEERRAALESRAKALRTRVVISGRQVFVPVKLRNGSAETDAMLLLDTGASSSVITPEVAERLRIEEATNVKIGVVGGRVMNARKVVLTEIAVGPVKRLNQEAVIVRQRQGMFGDGLLGMSFLAGLKYHIDFQTQTINWIPYD
ncbi:MAG TPA: hypothetical protein DCZ75_00930 [Geobacter sp.]|nr:hypothetical protein [Geobacter sp.]